ncbi:hypothetical protein PLESTB_001782400 [Pleodorina starrii]|uniref:Uncharacterized protein n=1 Tax=Pleodorina starrii TaxID=330485 RepID=A0A9W6C180_9CHLO|nr:hypothetical protein PLESTB_001782400 [Pleodorina starrii]
MRFLTLLPGRKLLMLTAASGSIPNLDFARGCHWGASSISTSFHRGRGGTRGALPVAAGAWLPLEHERSQQRNGRQPRETDGLALAAAPGPDSEDLSPVVADLRPLLLGALQGCHLATARSGLTGTCPGFEHSQCSGKEPPSAP